MNRRRRLRSQIAAKRFCCWCGQTVPDSEAWTGDISGAIAWSVALSESSLRKNATLCVRCGHERLRERVDQLNETTPELRLYPVSTWMFQGRGDPIPNLLVSVDFFNRYKKCDNPEQLAGLLLEFQSKWPIEWEWSGWKKDAIAELVLGYFGNGDSTKAAKRWLKGYREGISRQQPSSETEKQGQAYWAAVELLSLTSPKRPSKAVTVSEPILPVEQLVQEISRAFTRSLSTSLPVTSSPVRPTRDSYAVFICWLERSWYTKIDIERYRRNSKEAVSRFLKERKSPLDRSVLEEIADAYGKLYKPARRDPRTNKSKDEFLPPVSHVLLQFVATRHGVSPRLVSAALTKLRQSNKHS